VRRDRPFVEINCSTIPTHLVESELFGHERGAFTDARERKIGLVEAAHGGTLFLDEIGELDLAVQAKLLKLLEDKTVRRVGSVRDHKVDIRIVAATHRSLDDLVAEGRFRADLLYRLRVVGIEVPPLRRRGRDVLELADRFLAEQERRYGLSGRSFTAEAREALMGHAWPGNVRELRNVVERGVLTAAGDLVDCDDLGLAPLGRDTATSGGAHAIADVDLPWRAGQETVPLEEVERSTIERTLDRFDGNVSLAARALGVTRDTLRYRIRKHELRPTA
jgi:DNA-binding NtrC family response regulator